MKRHLEAVGFLVGRRHHQGAGGQRLLGIASIQLDAGDLSAGEALRLGKEETHLTHGTQQGDAQAVFALERRDGRQALQDARGRQASFRHCLRHGFGSAKGRELTSLHGIAGGIEAKCFDLIEPFALHVGHGVEVELLIDGVAGQAHLSPGVFQVFVDVEPIDVAEDGIADAALLELVDADAQLMLIDELLGALALVEIGVDADAVNLSLGGSGILLTLGTRAHLAGRVDVDAQRGHVAPLRDGQRVVGLVGGAGCRQEACSQEHW